MSVERAKRLARARALIQSALRKRSNFSDASCFQPELISPRYANAFRVDEVIRVSFEYPKDIRRGRTRVASTGESPPEDGDQS